MVGTLPEGVGLHVDMDYVDRPTNTFIVDWSSRQISGMGSGLAAMVQAVDIILQNERFKWQIYSSNFGSELEELVGEEYDYIISEIPRRVGEAFSVDSRILSVENFVFSEPGKDFVICTFDVVTIFGTLNREVVL